MRISTISLFSAALLLAAPTFAQTKGEDAAAKKRRSKIEERERQAAEAASTKGPSKKIKLEQAMDANISDFSVKAQRKRNEVIRKISKALPQQPEGDRADLIFQLAELFWQTSQFWYRQEYASFDKSLQAWFDSGGDEKTRPKLKTPKADTFKNQAIRNYDILLKKYPRYRRRDQVLYVMAYNLYLAGKKNGAVRKYGELVKKFPKSEFAADAYLALGEHFFNSNNVVKARTAFERALRTKKEKVINFATYKLAWCDYNQGEYADAVEKYQTVIRRSHAMRKNGFGEDAMELGDEAATDIVLAFSHLDVVEEVYDYLREVRDEEWAKRMVGKLGAIYDSQGKHDLSVRTYRFVLKKYPTHLDAPMYQSKIVTAFTRMNDRARVRTEMERLVDMYKPSSLWAKKVKKQGTEQATDAIERAFEYTEGTMRQLVTDYHAEAQKSKKAGTYRLARDIYKKYLDNFAQTDVCSVYETCEQARRLRFYYAEILYSLKEFRQAAEQYDVYVEEDPGGNFAKNAAFAAILCWEFIVKGEKPITLPDNARINESKGKRKKGQIKRTAKTTVKQIDKTRGKEFYTPKKIPADEISLANACDRYVDRVHGKSVDPKLKDQLIEVKFKAATIYHKYFHFEDSAKRFDELIARWPQNKFASFGALNVLDSLAVREVWSALNKYGRSFQKNKYLMRESKFKTSAAKYVEGSQFQLYMGEHMKAVETEKRATAKKNTTGLEKSKQMYAASAKNFLNFYKEFPDSQFTPISLVNAMNVFQAADEIDRGIDAAELLLKSYAAGDFWTKIEKLPSVDRKQKQVDYEKYEEMAACALPGFYVGIAKFEKAAQLFEHFAETYSGEHAACKLDEMLQNALIFQRVAGNTKKVLELRDEFAKKYGKKKKYKKDLANLAWQLALTYKASGQLEKAAKAYNDFPNRYGSLVDEQQNFESLYRVAMIWEELGKSAGDMKKIRRKISDRYDKLKAKDPLRQNRQVVRAAAYAKFHQIDSAYEKYGKLKIASKKGERMKKELMTMKDQLTALQQAYEKLMKLGDPATIVRSLTRMGLAADKFATAVDQSPTPKGLTMDQEIFYRKGLEEQFIFPYQQGAIDSLERARGVSFKEGVYNQATLDAQAALKKFKSNEFGEIVIMPFHASESFAIVGD
ncbi:MAG: hypothetical protein CMH50_12355 [Myxococcales bacterium]|nr:hypothetical protein [Myxococcales bacterium]